MILYLSSKEHTNLLDFTGWYDTDSDTLIKKMVGSLVLKQFIVYDMRNFSHVTEVVLDRIAFGDSDGEFAEAIEEFLTMYSPRITVIYEGLKQDTPLFLALLDSGVGNIVCGTEIAAIQSEIIECLSEQGMMRYHPKERTKNRRESNVIGLTVRISILPLFPPSREWELPPWQSVFPLGLPLWGLPSVMWRKMTAVF